MLVLYLYRRTVCTVLRLLYNESASPCSYPYYGCTIAQCVPCLYLLYSGLAGLAPRAVLILLHSQHGFVPCLYPLYMPARVMYLVTRACARTELVPSHSVYCIVPLVQESASPRSYSYPSCTIAQCVPCLYLWYSGPAWLASLFAIFRVSTCRTVFGLDSASRSVSCMCMCVYTAVDMCSSTCSLCTAFRMSTRANVPCFPYPLRSSLG